MLARMSDLFIGSLFAYMVSAWLKRLVSLSTFLCWFESCIRPCSVFIEIQFIEDRIFKVIMKATYIVLYFILYSDLLLLAIIVTLKLA